MSKPKGRELTAKEFDDKFDAGEDMAEHVDWSKSSRAVNLDLPVWVVQALDAEANRRGIARQALIKGWIVDRLDALKSERKPA